MVERLGPGDAESDALAVVLVHRALAEAGLHREDDALWDWHAALTINSKVSRSDISMYGEPAAFLKAHPPPFAPLLRASSEGVAPPKVRRRREPAVPEGAGAFGAEGILIIELTIDRDGRPRSPHLLKGLQAPTLAYVALDAIRQWRYTPATLNGQPVDIAFDVTFNFRK
jgi:TonB family protein